MKVQHLSKESKVSIYIQKYDMFKMNEDETIKVMFEKTPKLN